MTDHTKALADALKAMRSKYGAYACATCDQADAVLAAYRATQQAAALDELIASGEEIDNALAQQAEPEGWTPAELAALCGGKALPIMQALERAGRAASLNQRVQIEDIAAALAAPSLTVGERADGLTEEQIVTFLDAFQNDRKLLGDYEAFAGTARDIWAAALAPAAQAEPVAFVHWPLNGPPRLVWYSNKALHEAIEKGNKAQNAYVPDLLLYAPSHHPAQGVELPPLPEPRTLSRGDEDGPIQLGYTADQMHAYARAAIAQAPAATPTAQTAQEGQKNA